MNAPSLLSDRLSPPLFCKTTVPTKPATVPPIENCGCGVAVAVGVGVGVCDGTEVGIEVGITGGTAVGSGERPAQARSTLRLLFATTLSAHPDAFICASCFGVRYLPPFGSFRGPRSVFPEQLTTIRVVYSAHMVPDF